MPDLSKLSDADLEAVAAGDWSKVSEQGLQMLAGESPAAPAAPEFGAPPQLGADGQVIQPPKPAPAAPRPAAPRPQVSQGQQLMQDLAPVGEFLQQIPASIVGGAETAGALATGAVVAPVMGLGSMLKQIASEVLNTGQYVSPESQTRIRQATEAGFQAGTYKPQTATGQVMTGAIGKALAPVGEAALPLTPLMGGAPAAGPSLRAALPAAAAVAEEVIPEVVVAAKRLPGVEKVTAAVGGPKQSMGAALTPQALQRETEAAMLPVPIKMTKGQKTRAFEEQQFEREAAKDPAIGEPLRKRFAEQNAQVVQNLDAFIDETGAMAPDLPTIGEQVDAALRSRIARDKVRIRTLYKAADKAGELVDSVDTQPIVDWLNDHVPEAEVAPILKVARAKAIRLGLAVEGENGQLIATQGNLKNGELWRRSLNASDEPTNVKFATDLKKVYDEATKDVGGNLYKQARAARSRLARDYEDVSLIARLVKQKRGSADRAVALENVLNHSLLGSDASVASIKELRRVLQTQGAEGQQAWRELQGGLLAHIRDQITQSATKDVLGNTVVSADKFNKAITQLDKTGKLDFIYGKKGAEQLRTLNELSRDIFTAPPGSVNTSNTASALQIVIDSMATNYLADMAMGMNLPVPAVSALDWLRKWASKSKQRRRVEEALK